MVVGNSKNPDLFATQYQYDNNMLSNEAFLVRMVQSLSHYLGLNSKGYRFICYCIGYFFIILGLKKCNVSYFSFLMIYMIYPMMMDPVQTDNFIAMCIFFYAIVSFDENRRWNKTRCVFLILASACFHIAFISFLPFIFLVNIYSKRYIKVVILFSVLLSIVILVLRNNLRIMLINNGKGTEFRNYAHPGSKFGEEADLFIAAGGHYGNKSHNLVRHYSQDLGFKYLSASNKKEFKDSIGEFLSVDNKKQSIVLEVFTDNEDESNALKVINELQKEFKAQDAVANLLGEKGLGIFK